MAEDKVTEPTHIRDVLRTVMESIPQPEKATPFPIIQSGIKKMVIVSPIIFNGAYASMFQNLLNLCSDAGIEPEELIAFVFRVGVKGATEKVLDSLNGKK